MTKRCTAYECYRETAAGYALYHTPAEGVDEVDQWRCAEHHEGPLTKVLLPTVGAVEMAVNQESG